MFTHYVWLVARWVLASLVVAGLLWAVLSAASFLYALWTARD